MEQVVVVQQASTSFTGPIPHPHVLAQYGEVSPDLVNRIVSMAERQAEHRQTMERKLVDGSLTQAKRGQWCGLSVAAFGMIAACYCAYLGHEVAASIIGGIDIASLVGVFVLGQRPKKPRQVESVTIEEAPDDDEESPPDPKK